MELRGRWEREGTPGRKRKEVGSERLVMLGVFAQVQGGQGDGWNKQGYLASVKAIRFFSLSAPELRSSKVSWGFTRWR